jgi:hypothetical protein
LVTLGRTREVFLAQLPWLFALSVSLIIVAPRYGIAGVGATQAVVMVAVVGPVYAVLLRRAGVRIGDAGRALIPAFAWGLLSAGVAHVVSLTIDNPLLACIAGGLAGLAAAAIPFARPISRQAAAVLASRRARSASSSGTAIEPA